MSEELVDEKSFLKKLIDVDVKIFIALMVGGVILFLSHYFVTKEQYDRDQNAALAVQNEIRSDQKEMRADIKELLRKK
jgi:hypothetical protein